MKKLLLLVVCLMTLFCAPAQNNEVSNVENEKKALHEMVQQLYLLLPDLFDYSIEVGKPVKTTADECTLDCVVSLNSNTNTKSFYDVIKSCLQKLSVDKDANIPNKYRVLFDGKEYYLRTKDWTTDMNCLLKWGVVPKIYDFRITGKINGSGGEGDELLLYRIVSYYNNSDIAYVDANQYYGLFGIIERAHLVTFDGSVVDQLKPIPGQDYLLGLEIGQKHRNYNPDVFDQPIPKDPNKVPVVYLDVFDPQSDIVLFPFANPYNNKTLYSIELQLKLKASGIENIDEILVTKADMSNWSRVVKPALINPNNLSDPSLTSRTQNLSNDLVSGLFEQKYKDEIVKSGLLPSDASKYKECFFEVQLFVHDDGHISIDTTDLSYYLTSEGPGYIGLSYVDGMYLETQKIANPSPGKEAERLMLLFLNRYEELVSAIKVTPYEINGVIKPLYPIGGGLRLKIYPYKWSE